VTALLLFMLPPIAIFVLCRGRLEIGLLASIGLGQWLAGADLARDVHPLLFSVCLAGTIAWVVGYALAGSQRQNPGPRTEGAPSRYGSRSALGLLSIVTVALVVIHFARGGVPLFSANVETVRFQLARSGLLGLPSRAYLLGLPILVMAYAGLRVRSSRESRILLLVAITFAVSRPLGGLKSGLFEVMLVAMIALIIHQGAAPRLVSGPVMRRALIGLVAVVFAGYLATQYSTVRADSIGSATDYLVKRATVGTVSAGAYAVEGHGLTGGGPYLLKDLLYFTNKYAADAPEEMGLFRPPPYEFSHLISTSLVGVPVTTRGYVTPVATGLAPSLFLDWGWGGVCIGMAVAGFLLRRLQWRAVGASGLSAGLWGTAALTVTYLTTNGGLAYYAINFGAVAVLYILGAIMLRGIRHRMDPVQYESPGQLQISGASPPTSA
jgi:hypothetical protein